LKIVFVNRFFYPDISATSQMLSDAAFYLAGKGLEVHVVTSRLNYESEEKLVSRDVIKGVQVHRIWTSSFGRAKLLGRTLDYLTFYSSVFFSLLRLLDQSDHVVSKTDPPLVSVPVGWAARIKGAIQFNWLQDLFPEVAEEFGLSMPGLLIGLLRVFRDGSLLKAKINIVIGERMRDRVLKLGVYTDQVAVVPNWSDGESIRPARGENSFRDELSLQGRFVVGYSGNLGRAHEIDTLLGAMRQLENDKKICFLFIGSGALLDQLRQRVETEGLKNVMFQPYQPRAKLPLSLTLPDVHLTILRPSMEGLIVPSKIYGVLAAGKASIFIGDKEGEVSELLTSAGAGLAVQEGDADGLIEAIQKLNADSELTETMGRNARALFDEQLGAKRSLEKLEEILC
jgi:colanic acid biosynthesis glycosyl transferase WcaI